MFRIILVVLIISSGPTRGAGQEAPGPQTGAALKEETTPKVGRILERAAALMEKKKIDEALKILNDALPARKDKTYDRYALLTMKFQLLSGQSRHREALEAAAEKANIVASPRQALNVAKTYLVLGDSGHALEWLEASVARGLQSYTIFDEDVYKPLRDNPRFRSLSDTVKKRNGLGLPAKPFSGQTISGGMVSFDRYKGKVVLVDFWATWCPPCREEMPNLKRCYGRFKEKGFEIVGFAENDNDSTLTKFLKENSIAWPIVSNDSEGYEAAVLGYEVKNLPASFLIDRRGVLRHVNLTGDSLWKAIEELIKE